MTYSEREREFTFAKNEPKVISCDICLLAFQEGVINERFVAVSTVTGSRICSCFSKRRCDFSITRGWQQIMNAIRWIK